MAELIRKTANCGTMADWYKSQGRCYSYTTTPKVGDIVVYDWNGNHTQRHHVGIVEQVKDGGDTIITIEGNTGVGNDSNGGAVMRRTRERKYVTCWLRPAYASTAQRDAILARARAEIGVTEYPSGSNKVKYNTWYYDKEVSGSDYPWCAVWVCWVFLANTSGSTGTSSSTSKSANAAKVKEFQKWLNTNYNTGLEEDGKFGVKTRAGAIKAWQTEMNKQYGTDLEVDGVYGKLSREAAKKCKVYKGATGNFTRIIQGLLYCEGYNPNGFDGKFGNGMYTAVMQFQKDDGVSPDGVVGPNTWTVLFE